MLNADLHISQDEVWDTCDHIEKELSKFADANIKESRTTFSTKLSEDLDKHARWAHRLTRRLQANEEASVDYSTTAMDVATIHRELPKQKEDWERIWSKTQMAAL